MATLTYDAMLKLYAGSNLEAWWKLADANGSTTAADSSGNDLTLAVAGTVVFGQTGPLPGTPADTGASFASVGSLSIADTVALDFGTGSFTVVAWFNQGALSGSAFPVIAQKANGIGNPGWELFENAASNLIEAFISDGTNQVEISHSASSYTNSQWHMAAFVIDRTAQIETLYLDGVSVASASISSVGSVTNAYSFAISSDGANTFPGSQGQVANISAALTSTQVSNLYAARSTPVSGHLGWLAVLNQLAGTSNLGENQAANVLSYGSDKHQGLLKALNDMAGTTNLGLDLVCNKIAGTSGLSALAALNSKAGNAKP